MAYFENDNYGGINMLSLEFRRLTPTFLNSRNTTLSATSIDREYGDSSYGGLLEYTGTFTFTYASDGSVLAAQGQLTSYDVFDWEDAEDSYLAYWEGFEIRDFNVDLALFQGPGGIPLLRTIFAGDDLIHGNGGRDSLYGFAGDDDLSGYSGSDTLYGDGGYDTLRGGDGDDTYYVENAGDMIVELGTASAGKDTVRSTVGIQLAGNVENLVLLEEARFGYGNTLANQMTGNAVSNLLKGGEGADTMAGGDGDDRLYGNRGADALSGDAGADTFFFNSVRDSNTTTTDRVGDFLHGMDILNLAGIDANSQIDGNQKFKFIGAVDFNANATAQLRFVYDSATDTGTLFGSTDPDGAAEFVLRLSGVSTLVSSDLVL